MVRPSELVEAVLYTLQKSDDLPEETNFIGYEPDINTDTIKLPLVQVSLGEQANVNRSNTEFIGYQKDNNGNNVGYIYESLYTQEMEVSAWTAQDSRFDPREMSDTIRDEIYSHVTSGPNVPLRHPSDDRTLDEVWSVSIDEGVHTDDLTTSPVVRRWEQQLQIAASEQYIAKAEDPAISEISDLIVGQP